MSARTMWAAVLGGAALLDLACDRAADGSTLSTVTRGLYRTDTLPGRVAFVASWSLLSSWLIPHIINGPLAGSSPISR